MNSITVPEYANAEFVSNADHTLQLAIVITLVNSAANAALIHYASWKNRRVVRPSFPVEVYTFPACCDYCSALSEDIFSMLGRKFAAFLMSNSKLIFGTTTK